MIWIAATAWSTQPYVPILYYSIPLEVDGANVAVLVAKVSLTPLFADILSRSTTPLYLVSRDGSYLLNPDPTKLYGGMLNNQITFDDERARADVIAMFGSQQGIVTELDRLPRFASALRPHPAGDADRDSLAAVPRHPDQLVLGGNQRLAGGGDLAGADLAAGGDSGGDFPDAQHRPPDSPAFRSRRQRAPGQMGRDRAGDRRARRDRSFSRLPSTGCCAN